MGRPISGHYAISAAPPRVTEEWILCLALQEIEWGKNMGLRNVVSHPPLQCFPFVRGGAKLKLTPSLLLVQAGMP
jgi:hypothetical protein